MIRSQGSCTRGVKILVDIFRWIVKSRADLQSAKCEIIRFAFWPVPMLHQYYAFHLQLVVSNEITLEFAPLGSPPIQRRKNILVCFSICLVHYHILVLQFKSRSTTSKHPR